MSPQVEQAILYLYRMGFGKDSISLILKDVVKSGPILTFLKAQGPARTKEETIALRMKNGILSNGGKAHYAVLRKRMKELFPSLPWLA